MLSGMSVWICLRFRRLRSLIIVPFWSRLRKWCITKKKMKLTLFLNIARRTCTKRCRRGPGGIANLQKWRLRIPCIKRWLRCSICTKTVTCIEISSQKTFWLLQGLLVGSWHQNRLSWSWPILGWPKIIEWAPENKQNTFRQGGIERQSLFLGLPIIIKALTSLLWPA